MKWCEDCNRFINGKCKGSWETAKECPIYKRKFSFDWDVARRPLLKISEEIVKKEKKIDEK